RPVQASSAAIFLCQAVDFLWVDKDLAARVQPQHFFHRFVAQHADERWIDVQESSVQRAPVNSEYGAQNQGTVTGFRSPQGLFIAFMFNGRRQLLGNELENLAVLLPEADILAVALYHQRSQRGRAAFQRNSQPVQRWSPNQFHFSGANQFLKHGRRRQQRLARSHYVLRKAAPDPLGSRRRIHFIYEIREGQQLRLRVVKRDVQIARIHQLPDDVVKRGIELLQILGRLAARRDRIQRGVQCLGPLLFGDVAIAGVRSDRLALQHYW